MPLSRPMPSIEPGAAELRIRDRAGIYRAFYYSRSPRGTLTRRPNPSLSFRAKQADFFVRFRSCEKRRPAKSRNLSSLSLPKDMINRALSGSIDTMSQISDLIVLKSIKGVAP